GHIVANEDVALGVLGQVNLEATKSITIGANGEVLATHTIGTPGSVTVSAPLVKIQGGTINTNSANAQASPITITADKVQLSNGAVISADREGTASGTGGAGTISITAGREVNLRNGTVVSADATGTGNAGHITIEAGKKVDIQDSSVSAQAQHGN